MNTSQNCSEDLDITIKLYQASSIIAYYVLTPISAFGLILNLLTVILLERSKLTRLNTTFYESFFCKCFCDLCVCLFGIVNMNFSCYKCILVTDIGNAWSSNSSYEYIFFISFIEVPGMRVAMLASAYSEIALILNR